MAHNAAALVNAYRVKLRLIYDLWVDMADGDPVTLEELRNVYGAEAYEFNNNVWVKVVHNWIKWVELKHLQFCNDIS